MKNIKKICISLLCVLLFGGAVSHTVSNAPVQEVPAYTYTRFIEINENQPGFEELSTESFEFYSDLDYLGRCGMAYACIGKDIMPTEERGAIGHIKPSGWHTVKYNGLIDGNYLYNRCHLIGYQLAGENANEKNLITGTRQFNVEGMLPFENMVAEYVRETGNHVMYRVTPIYEGTNLVASGVQMEAYSVEDNGSGVNFNVFVHNVQDGISIDYATGESTKIETSPNDGSEETPKNYVVNGNNGKIHIVGICSATRNEANAMSVAVYFETYEEALEYSKQLAPNLEKRDCGNCW